jgi:S-adenosylmethionine/arginine decarboxylase-like enzyme
MLQHKHVIVTAKVLAPPGKNDFAFMNSWFTSLIEAMHMKIMFGPHFEYCDMKGNEGFTGIAIIETSHVVCHFWDAESPGILEFDLYTCGDMYLDKVFEHLQVFKPTSITYKYLDRENYLEELDKGTIIYAENEQLAA